MTHRNENYLQKKSCLIRRLDNSFSVVIGVVVT